MTKPKVIVKQTEMGWKVMLINGNKELAVITVKDKDHAYKMRAIYEDYLNLGD